MLLPVAHPVSVTCCWQLLGTLRACLQGGGGPQAGEVTRLGEVKK